MKRKKLRTRSFEVWKNKRAEILMLHFKTRHLLKWREREHRLSEIDASVKMFKCVNCWPKLKSNYSRNLQFYLRFRSVALEDDVQTRL